MGDDFSVADVARKTASAVSSGWSPDFGQGANNYHAPTPGLTNAAAGVASHISGGYGSLNSQQFSPGTDTSGGALGASMRFAKSYYDANPGRLSEDAQSSSWGSGGAPDPSRVRDWVNSSTPAESRPSGNAPAPAGLPNRTVEASYATPGGGGAPSAPSQVGNGAVSGGSTAAQAGAYGAEALGFNAGSTATMSGVTNGLGAVGGGAALAENTKNSVNAINSTLDDHGVPTGPRWDVWEGIGNAARGVGSMLGFG